MYDDCIMTAWQPTSSTRYFISNKDRWDNDRQMLFVEDARRAVEPKNQMFHCKSVPIICNNEFLTTGNSKIMY